VSIVGNYLFYNTLISHSPSSPITTLFFPLRIHPYTDGYSWARKEGYERHAGLMPGEELTDDDDDDV